MNHILIWLLTLLVLLSGSPLVRNAGIWHYLLAAKTLTYTRGLDLSGSVDGAGGIGGLLGITTRATNIWQHYYYDLDGVGNVVGLLDTNETFVARYRYDPYGNLLSFSGPMAGLNRLRFSGKEWHPQPGLTHFGFRDYDPGLQRWLTEDPLGELGGINLFQFVDNDPVNLVDPFGLDTYLQNRELNPKGLTVRAPVEHPVSHTFVYTTNPDGSLDNTYSWGNQFDPEGKGLWVRNAPEDRSAVENGIRQRGEYEKASWWKKPFLPDNFGQRVGDEKMDKKIGELFETRLKDPSRHKWLPWNNCKHEARRLVDDAKK